MGADKWSVGSFLDFEYVYAHADRFLHSCIQKELRVSGHVLMKDGVYFGEIYTIEIEADIRLKITYRWNRQTDNRRKRRLLRLWTQGKKEGRTHRKTKRNEHGKTKFLKDSKRRRRYRNIEDRHIDICGRTDRRLSVCLFDCL